MNIYNNEKKSKIREEAQRFFDYEKYGTLLDNYIKEFIEKEKNITNLHIIDLIIKYDIFYTVDKIINKRDEKIFDKINFETVDEEFLKDFKKQNFELKFKNNIGAYLEIFFSKVKHLKDLVILLKLININNLSDKNLHI